MRQRRLPRPRHRFRLFRKAPRAEPEGSRDITEFTLPPARLRRIQIISWTVPAIVFLIIFLVKCVLAHD